MSKVALITDIHVGARNDSSHIANHQIKFFQEQFFPELKRRKIDEVICLGDLFDRRQYTNHRIIDRWVSEVFEPMAKQKVKFHLILGNHDIAFRNSLAVNSPKLFLSHYKNITIYDRPQEVEIGGNTFAFLPWICAENYSDSITLLETTKCSTAFGHLEVENFEMYRGQVCHEGMKKSMFKRLQYAFSGHYHHKSDDGQIFYLGNPFEFTWADYNDPRGFHIFDTQTLELEFIQNSTKMFYRLEYDDKDKKGDYWSTFDLSDLAGKYVKVVVTNKTDPYQFDRLLDALYNANTADFKIVEDMSDFDADSIADDDLELEDSMSLVDSYIDASEFEGSKDNLKSMMKSLYVESLSVLE